MNELINKLQQELKISFYYISRPEGKVPCVVYNYKKKLRLSDMKKESSKFDFYFILIINTRISSTIEKFEEILIDNLFSDVSVNQSALTKEGYVQVSVTGSKNI